MVLASPRILEAMRRPPPRVAATRRGFLASSEPGGRGTVQVADGPLLKRLTIGVDGEGQFMLGWRG